MRAYDDIYRRPIEQKRPDPAKTADQQRRINYGLTFSTSEGFDVLKDLCGFCHVNAPSYVSRDTHETAFREGERNVFLYILSQLSDEMKQKISIGG